MDTTSVGVVVVLVLCLPSGMSRKNSIQNCFIESQGRMNEFGCLYSLHKGLTSDPSVGNTLEVKLVRLEAANGFLQDISGHRHLVYFKPSIPLAPVLLKKEIGS